MREKLIETLMTTLYELRTKVFKKYDQKQMLSVFFSPQDFYITWFVVDFEFECFTHCYLPVAADCSQFSNIVPIRHKKKCVSP